MTYRLLTDADRRLATARPEEVIRPPRRRCQRICEPAGENARACESIMWHLQVNCHFGVPMVISSVGMSAGNTN